MTASISRNAFIYGATESISEIVFPVALTAARYAVLTYDVATSDEAKATYKWVSSMTVALGQMAFWSLVWAYAKISVWAEAEVQSCIQSEIDHVPDAGEMVEADPFSPDENPAYATVPAAMAPVATLVVKAEPAAQPVTSAELRRQCQDAGIKWRNAHGNGRHLSKGEMIAALQEIECWALSEGCLA